MSTGQDFFIMQQVSALQSKCSMAQRNIAHASSLTQVVREVQVTVPGYLRHAVQRELHQLQMAGERRAQELLKAQFKELDALQGPALAERLRVLRTNEWRFLGGHFPRLAQDANREGLRYHQRSVNTNPPEDSGHRTSFPPYSEQSPHAN